MISAFDRVFAWVELVTSSLGAGAGSVLVNLQGLADSDADPEAETSSGEELWTMAGVVFRPLDRDATGAAEALAARRTDGLTPVASRDLRITKARGAVDPGTLSLAGYGGAHVSIAYDKASGKDVVTVSHSTGSKVTIAADGTVTVMGPNGTIVLGTTGITAAWTPPGAAVEVVLNSSALTLLYAVTGAAATLALVPTAGGQVQVSAPGGITVNGTPVAVP